jgi:signal peptidase II
VAFVLIAALGTAADLLTKYWVFEWRGMPRHGNEWWLWEGWIGIETATNAGALFGRGRGYGNYFAAFSVVAAAGILVWLFCYRAARDCLLTVALSCVMGGIVGNLYDRLGLWQEPGRPGTWHNEVRDWILLRYHDHSWPNFNIADSLLVCGAALLLWHGFFVRHPPEPRRPGSPAPSGRPDS